jgi:PAS domain-containing protein
MIYEEMDFTDARNLRREAEKRLNEKHRKKAEDLKETDANKLLHELQVHQIELEMQNEELRQAYEKAEKALEKYTMLFDLSPVGYFSLDDEATICDLNFTGADMLRERRFSLLNANFKLFIPEDSRPVFNQFLKKVYTSNAKESCKVLLGQNNESLARVYMEGVVTEDAKKCLLSVVDISKFSNV